MFTGLAIKAFFSGLFAYVGALLTFLTTKPGVYLLIAGVAAGAYWYSGHEGYKRGVSETVAAQKIALAQAESAARKDAAAYQAAADKITHDADVANAAAHSKITTITQHIIQKVPVYVTAETDARFPLPCGFVRLHDAAASGVEPSAVPIPADKSDADKCDVTASYAASIIAGNYGLALGWKSDAETWVKWYADQSAKWGAK